MHLLPLLATALLLPHGPVPAESCAPHTQVRQEQQGGDELAASLLGRGRALLEGGEYGAALDAFHEADSLLGGRFESKVWIWRTWFSQGRINDAFDALDNWRDRHGAEGAAVDYLYGIGSYVRAHAYVEQEVAEVMVQRAFDDARTYLAKATAADPELYGDALLPLAESAWRVQVLDESARAVAAAIARRPENPAPHLLAGRIAAARYYRLKDGTGRDAEAAREIEGALAAFARARALCGDPGGEPVSARYRPLVADAWLETAYLHQAKEDAEAARAAFSASLSIDPERSNYPDLWTRLEPAVLVELFSEALARNEARAGAADLGPLLWWLGYAQLSSGRFDEAEAAYARAAELHPEYHDCAWFIGLARYRRNEIGTAVDAWRPLWKLRPEVIVQRAKELGVEAACELFAWAIDHCHRGERPIDAAWLCEARVGCDDARWRHWNDLGFFTRIAGEFVNQRGEEGDAGKAERVFERALYAYARARELAPARPHLLNDAARILHYDLGRDLDKARTMYEEAIAEASALLARGHLVGTDLEDCRGALENARKNLAALDE